jgi:hypothetical protein
LKIKGRLNITKVEAESQAVLNNLTENDFQERWEWCYEGDGGQ